METKNTIKAYIPRILFLLCLVLSFPAQSETRQFTYQVYAGGFHVVEAKLFFDIKSDNNYEVSLDAYTRGWLSSMVPWKGNYLTRGTIKNDGFYPQNHVATSFWKDETEVKTFTYKDNKLTSLTIKDHDKPLENIEADQILTEGTTDILSATLAVMQNVATNYNCTGTSDIYDGKRRFTLMFKDQGESELRKSSYNIFSGPAQLCTVEIEPKGGKWHEKPRGWLSIQEQGRQKGALPAVWMGVVEGFELAVPVRIRVKTDYGTLLMHLTDVK